MADIKSDYIDGNTPLDTVPALWLNTAALKINQLPTSGIAASLALANSSMQDTDIAAAQLVVINPQTANYTVVLSDHTKTIEFDKATAGTVTIPPNSGGGSVAFPIGSWFEVMQVGVGQVTIVEGTGVTVLKASTLKTRVQNSTIGVRKRSTNGWVLTGDAE